MEKTTEAEAAAVIIMAINVAASALIMANIDDEGVYHWCKLCSKNDDCHAILKRLREFRRGGLRWSIHYAIYMTPILAFFLPVLRHNKECQGSFIWQ